MVGCWLFIALGCGRNNPTPVATDTWSWSNPLPQGNELYAVFGISASDIFAVGQAGTIVRYNGSTWSFMDSGTNEVLSAVWGSAGNNVYAVGNRGLILKYNGSSWAVDYVYPDTSVNLNSIFGFSATDVYAGGAGVMLHYDGTRWSMMEIGRAGYIKGIWGTSHSNLYAVDNLGLIHKYNGSVWTVAADYSPDAMLESVWGAAANDVYACGNDMDGNYIYHYNGSTWEVVYQIEAVKHLTAVWGSAANDVYAVGAGGIMLHYDGTAWSEQAVYSVGYNGLWGSSAGNVLLVGNYGALIRKNGASWNIESGQYVWNLDALWGTGPSNVYAAGSSGTILHYNGSAWSLKDSGTSDMIVGLWGTADNDIFSVINHGGEFGEISHYGGTGWTQSCTSEYGFVDIWGTASNDVFAVGSRYNEETPIDAEIIHYNGAAWSVQKVLTDRALFVIGGTAANDVFAAGDIAGEIYHYNGSTWETLSSGLSARAKCFYGFSNHEVYAGSDSGQLARYNGSSWSVIAQLDVVGHIAINGIYGTAGSDLFLMCSDGVRRYDGSTISALMPSSLKVGGNLPAKIWGSSNNDIFIVGLKGMILHYGP